MHDKFTLRQRMREQLGRLDSSFIATASRQIADHVLQYLEVNICLDASCRVALFGGLKSEPDLVSHLLPVLEAKGAGACLFHIEQHSLQPRQIHTLEDLRRGPMNVLEPGDQCQSVDIAALDVVLVPGLAFTQAGVRLGRGGGYYDRLLVHPAYRARSVAIAFDCQIVDRIPAEPHDQSVCQIITESGLISPSELD